MPLLKFHLCKGRDDREVGKLFDATQRVMVATLSVPDADLYRSARDGIRTFP